MLVDILCCLYLLCITQKGSSVFTKERQTNRKKMYHEFIHTMSLVSYFTFIHIQYLFLDIPVFSNPNNAE